MPSTFNQDTQHVNHTINILQRLMARFGYQPITTPIIERADLFLTRAGDQVINKLFTFTRHGQELALRPEFTAIAAHNFIHHAHQGVARWQFSGPIFIDDPDSFQHNYQQESLGAELIGLAGPAIDAEIIGLAVQGLLQIHVSEFQLVIGHTGLTRQLLKRYRLDSRTEQFLLKHVNALHQPDLGKAYVFEQYEYSLTGRTADSAPSDTMTSNPLSLEQAEANTQQMLQSLLDATRRSATMGGRTQHDIARRLLQKQQRLTEKQQVHDALTFLEEWTGIVAEPSAAFRKIEPYAKNDSIAVDQLQRWQETIRLLDAYGIDPATMVIQPYLARNWEYYTGIVFEMNSKNNVQLGSGGRYDELVALIGGNQAVPAVGFAYYLDQIFNCITSPSPDLQQTIYIIMDDANVHAASALAVKLRAHDMTAVLLPADLMDGGQTAVHIDSNGQIHFGTQQFTMSAIDLLITAIRQKAHGE